MISTLLDDIEQKALAATPGPWHLYDGDNSYAGDVTFGDQSDRGGYYLRDSDKFEKDDIYIAAMSPTTTLALVSALRVAMEALEIISKMRGEAKNGPWTIADSALTHIDELFEKEKTK